MCILIVKKGGSSISDEALENSYDSNPDGWGFSYVNVDHVGVRRLMVKKGLSSFPDFLAKFRKAEENAPDSNFLLHFRISTSGGVIKENCHPFYVDDTMVFAHNGIISHITKTDLLGTENDTRAFGRLFLYPLKQEYPSFFLSPSINNFIESYLSTTYMKNKVAILTLDNEVHIYNERLGEWVDGVWYSNNSYKTIRQSKWYNNTGAFRGRGAKMDTPYTKEGIYVIDENGVGKWVKDVKMIGAIVPYRTTMTSVMRLFKNNTLTELIHGITHYWDDISGDYYSADGIDDQILTQYLEGNEYYCTSCNILMTKEEIIGIRGATHCPYCKKIAHHIEDDIRITTPEEDRNEFRDYTD